MKIVNQNLQTLDFKQFTYPNAFTDISATDTTDGLSDDVKHEWFKSVFDHIMQGGTVTDDNGEDISEQILEAMSSEDYSEDNERLIMEFYSRTLSYKLSNETALISDNIVPIQHSLELQKNPNPELSMWMLPTDLSGIPMQTGSAQINVVAYNDADMCKAAELAIKYKDIRPLEIAITALYHPEALCINLESDNDWKTLTTRLANAAQMMHQMKAIDDATMVILSQIFSAKMDADTLTLAIALRSNVSPNAGAGSFGRVLMELLKPEIDRFMPVSLRNFWYPRNIIFVNDYAHQHSTAEEISREWRTIMKECAKKARPVAINELRKLDKAHNGDTNHECGHDRGVQAVSIDFKNGIPKVPQMYKRIKKLVERKSLDEISAHPYIDVRTTFARASRTKPDDWNKKGTVKKVSYYKDLHLYCDCSGSVSFENLQNTIVASIKVAKKLGLDLYLTTWGSSISQSTKVPIMGHTDKQIINYIVNLPMSGGGTNPDLVWDRCRQTKKRRNEIAIMITDFEFCTPRTAEGIPTNLYYMPLIPTRGNISEYQHICGRATDFMRSMSKIYNKPVTNVRKRFLF